VSGSCVECGDQIAIEDGAAIMHKVNGVMCCGSYIPPNFPIIMPLDGEETATIGVKSNAVTLRLYDAESRAESALTPTQALELAAALTKAAEEAGE